MYKSFRTALMVSAVSAWPWSRRNSDKEYQKYLAEFGKQIDDLDDYERRKNNWLNIDDKIAEYNEKRGANFTVGHTKFSDWDDAEFEQILGYKQVEGFERNLVTLEETEGFGVNWVSNGGVSAVGD